MIYFIKYVCLQQRTENIGKMLS